ncbi:MAG TPA: DUF423 domain-containing protein [Vicinamibacterales bacterium]|jgi:uncharacterized membrane protein YgdD (TMEM256/DUF423 family)|nr:DUF423 domain-containing protein [Vicinamibacterales bacterium]
MDRTILFIGALAGLTGVAFGAFGAHFLKARLTAEMLAVFETGVRYQLYHAAALVGAAALSGRISDRSLTLAGWLFGVGIVLFSGSLYALALTGIGVLGAITPLGGVAFIAGWLCLLLAAI